MRSIILGLSFITFIYSQVPTLLVTQNALFGTNSIDQQRGTWIDQARGVRYCVGDYYPTTTASYDVVVIKFNISTQQLIWNYTYNSGPGGSDFGFAITGQPDGSVLVAGTTDGNFNNATHIGRNDAFLMKLNSEGNIIWTTIVGTTNDESLGESLDNSCIAYDIDNGVTWILGTTYGTFPGYTRSGSSDSDGFLAAIDDSGNVVLIQQFGGSVTEFSASVAVIGNPTRISIFGNTFSANFPVTPNAQQPNRKDLNSDAYIRSYTYTRASNVLTLLYSSYFNPTSTSSYPGLGSVSIDANGNYYALFATKTIYKFDSNFNIVWGASITGNLVHARYIPVLNAVSSSFMTTIYIFDANSGNLLTSLDSKNYTYFNFFDFYSAASYVVDASNVLIYPIATAYYFLNEPVGVQYKPNFGSDVNFHIFSILATIPSTSAAFTTNAVSPFTTGRLITSEVTTSAITSSRLTTRSPPISTSRLTTSRVTTGSATTGSIVGNTCIKNGEQKCLTNNTYSTCTNGKYSIPQNCGSGLVCSSVGINIYCIPYQDSTSSSSIVGTPCSIDREQRCLSDGTYSTCTNGYFSIPQYCKPGRVCTPGSVPTTIYCL